MSNGILLFLNMGGSEIVVILGVALLLFGGKKLPELARGLGKGIREFKDASEGVKREIHRNINAVNVEEELDVNDNSRHHPNTTVESPRLDQIEDISEINIETKENTTASENEQVDEDKTEPDTKI